MTKVMGAIVTFAASQLGNEFLKLKQLRALLNLGMNCGVGTMPPHHNSYLKSAISNYEIAEIINQN